jgi:pimeloyl-ACP methyl ester carboxylesterase
MLTSLFCFQNTQAKKGVNADHLPDLLLWAESDRHFLPAHTEWLHRLIPGSHCELVAAAGHWMAGVGPTEPTEFLRSKRLPVSDVRTRHQTSASGGPLLLFG